MKHSQNTQTELRDDERLYIFERWNRIEALLNETSVTPVEHLAHELSVSPATIRRDLLELDAVGRLRRVRGGAVALPSYLKSASQNNNQRGLRGQVDSSVSIHRNSDAKRAIGRYAATLLVHGEAVIIDGGTTTLELANHITTQNLTVLTSSVLIMNALLSRPNTRILITGGEVFQQQSIILNPYGNDIANQFSATKLFIGAQAITSRGLMQTDPLLVQNERELIERAEKLVVLADSSKFDSKGSLSVCPLSRIDLIITDEKLAPETKKRLEDEHGLEIAIAPAADS